MEKATSTIKVATEWKEPGLEELTPQLWSDLIISNYLPYQNNSETHYNLFKPYRMSLLKMELQHAFGSTCSQGYRNCVAICEEDKNETRVAFPIGKALARKSVDRSEMTFVNFAGTISSTQTISMRSKTFVYSRRDPM